MPNKNTVRSFQPRAVYHIYNRGVAKQKIFLDEQDYKAFIRRLELLLLPKDEADKLQQVSSRIRVNNLYGKVKLLSFCLMPNHFHLILKQEDDSHTITQFMRTLSTSYSMYFNKKYDRVGPIFQGKYKAAWVDNDTYLLHLSRYIHCNPLVLGVDVHRYPFSSLQYYFKRMQPAWVNASDIEEMFLSDKEYFKFVEDIKEIQEAAEKYDL